MYYARHYAHTIQARHMTFCVGKMQLVVGVNVRMTSSYTHIEDDK
jgi:hypothetical protein